MKHTSSLSRRRVMKGLLGLGVGATVGCQPKVDPTAAPEAEERVDVPLRIAIVSDLGQQDAEFVRRSWEAVTQQPLTIQTLPTNRAKFGSLSPPLHDAAKKNDLLIFPLSLIADLVAAELIVPLRESEFADIEQESGALLTALRNGAALFAGEYYSLPIGSAQPAFLVNEIDSNASGDPPETWQAYDVCVEAWEGAASEPSTPGWAGAMYLWRTSGIQNWLFSRDALSPQVHTEPYIESLELMVQTNRRYKSGRKTPDQIWNDVGSGALRGGIGFPVGESELTEEVQIRDLPGSGDLSRVLLNPFSSMIAISANCRQSTAASRFIRWIGGETAGETLRDQVSGMTVVRDASGAGTSSRTSNFDYESWLSQRLGSPLTIPTLQVRSAARYYESLDYQITRALDGETSPKQALEAVTQSWQELTKEVGLEKQLRAWQRAW